MFNSVGNVIAVLTTLLVVQLCVAEENQAIWIDVRTPAEYASGHVQGAVNIEFQLVADKIAEITDNKTADIRLYCRSGRRSSVAKESLTKLGYENVSNEGGYAAALVAYKNGRSSP